MAVNLEQELRKAQRNLREAHDEIERLDRIEVKYNNLCDVLNELTDENTKLQAVVDAAKEFKEWWHEDMRGSVSYDKLCAALAALEEADDD
jgi:t-SNARE complex subunit (syntaxin)